MGIVRVVRSSMKQYIRDMLIEEITAGELAVGKQLPSIRELAERFDTSISPVHQALEELEEQGYVIKKNGAGTFVADASSALSLGETVALGLGTRAHVWGELELLLARELSRVGLPPIIFDASTPEGRERLTGLARSDTAAFVLHGRRGLPFEKLQSPLFREKTIVGIVEWRGPEMENLVRVLSDFSAGGEMVADHLELRGHRKVLIVVPRMEQIEKEGGGFEHGRMFMREWQKRGGDCSVIASEGWKDEMPIFDNGNLLSHFEGETDFPTAVFGLMDVESFAVQRLLRRECPDRVNEVEFIGYYNTPWSRAGEPPFTSVDLNLEGLAERGGRALRKALLEDEPGGSLDYVRPKLVVR
ncbi:MAG: GntR family transcriptional regulator [Candidatus Brocadiia bacterium]